MRRRNGHILSVSLGIGVGAAIVGCASLDELAPPVHDSMVHMAALDGTSRAGIEHGRSTYITQCTRCHSPEPVTRYDADAWDEILPRMSTKANLTHQQGIDLRSYLEAVLRSQSAAR